MPSCCGSTICNCVVEGGGGILVTGAGSVTSPFIVEYTGTGGGGGNTLPALLRVATVAYSASRTPNADTTDVYNIGALTGGITINNPSGTPVDGQMLRLRFLQDGTGGRVITWGSQFAFGTDITTALIPLSASTKWEMLFTYHSGDVKWRTIGLVRGF